MSKREGRPPIAANRGCGLPQPWSGRDYRRVVGRPDGAAGRWLVHALALPCNWPECLRRRGHTEVCQNLDFAFGTWKIEIISLGPRRPLVMVTAIRTITETTVTTGIKRIT